MGTIPYGSDLEDIEDTTCSSFRDTASDSQHNHFDLNESMSSVDKFFSQKSIDSSDQNSKQANTKQAPVKRKNPGSNKINKQLQARVELRGDLTGKPVELQQFQGQISQGHQFIQVRLNDDGSGYSLVNDTNSGAGVGNKIVFGGIAEPTEFQFQQQLVANEVEKKNQVKKRRKKNEEDNGAIKGSVGTDEPLKTVQSLICGGNIQQAQPQQSFAHFSHVNPSNLTNFSVMENNSFNLNNNSTLIQTQVNLQDNNLKQLQSQQYHQQQQQLQQQQQNLLLQQQIQQQQQHQVKNLNFLLNYF